MLPVLKDNTQPLLGRLLSSSLEPAGQKKKTDNPEKQTKFQKTLSHMNVVFEKYSWKTFLDCLYPKYDDFTLNN